MGMCRRRKQRGGVEEEEVRGCGEEGNLEKVEKEGIGRRRRRKRRKIGITKRTMLMSLD
jgi:hypothetical protein